MKKNKSANYGENSGDRITVGDVGEGAAVAAGRGAKAVVHSFNKALADKVSGLSKINKYVKVFLSSTWFDLQPERETVEHALHQMKSTLFVGMEYFGSRSEDAKTVSLEEVKAADIYIGIFGFRYGSGITEDEYQEAKKINLPTFIYIKDDEIAVPKKFHENDPEKLKKFNQLINELHASHVIKKFSDPEELALNVVMDLHNHLKL